MLQNAYLLAEIGADTAESEQHLAEILTNISSCQKFSQEAGLGAREVEHLAERDLEVAVDLGPRPLAREPQDLLPSLRTPVNNIEYFPPNFEGLVLGCIDADFCK